MSAGLTNEQAHLNGRGGTVVRTIFEEAELGYVVTFDQALRDGGQREMSGVPEGDLKPEPA